MVAERDRGDPPRKSRRVVAGGDEAVADRSHLPPDEAVDRSSREAGCSIPEAAEVDAGGNRVAGVGGGVVAGTGTDQADPGARSNRAEAGTRREACTGHGTDLLRGASAGDPCRGPAAVDDAEEDRRGW